MKKNPIGGYFELELPNNKHDMFENYIGLNSGRNCLEYILRAKKCTKIYISYYSCDVLLEPLKKLNIPYEFYDLDFNLEPLFDYSNIKESDAFLYTNYFGIKDIFINDLSHKISANLIIDNAQALFAKPLDGIPTFYSPRKFVGVPDGGFVKTNKQLDMTFEKDQSFDRMSHLIKRIDLSAELGYADFCINDKSLENQAIKKISNLTTRIISSIDVKFVATRRKENFAFLHKNLAQKNLLNISIHEGSVPMIYPFRTHDSHLKDKLINEKIYCASYWPNVFTWCSEEKNSYTLAKEIIALPIDQRYSIEDMKKILEYV